MASAAVCGGEHVGADVTEQDWPVWGHVLEDLACRRHEVGVADVTARPGRCARMTLTAVRRPPGARPVVKVAARSFFQVWPEVIEGPEPGEVKYALKRAD